MSNQVIYNLTAPHKRNYQIPGFAVMDMDKVLEKKDKQNRFLFKKLKDYPIAKETFHFGEQRGNTLYQDHLCKAAVRISFRNNGSFSGRLPRQFLHTLRFRILPGQYDMVDAGYLLLGFQQCLYASGRMGGEKKLQIIGNHKNLFHQFVYQQIMQTDLRFVQHNDRCPEKEPLLRKLIRTAALQRWS